MKFLPLLFLLVAPLIAAPNYRAELIRWEGFSLVSYADNGFISAGIGHNLTSGRNKGNPKYKAGQRFTALEVESFFIGDLANALQFARKGVKNFDSLPDEAKLITISLIFTTGGEGFLKFKNFRLALSHRMFNLAANELGMSKWAKQLPNRAQNHIRRLEKLP